MEFLTLIRLNVNEDFFSGHSLSEIDNILKNSKKSIANNLEEAVIHECGHAKLIKGKKVKEIEKLYDELKNIHIEGISEIAYEDGAEALAEIEILISRKSNISQKIMEFYEKYIRR